MRILIFSVLLYITFLGCQEKQVTAERMVFFSMKDFVQTQDSLLTLKDGALKKILLDQNGKEERTIDDPDWGAELEILLEYELNKNANQGEYEKDSSDGMVLYDLKSPSSRLDIKEQKIWYSEAGDLMKITAVKERENWLYRSKSILEVELGPGNLISSYKLDFDKKVIFLGPEKYSIEVQPQ